MNLVILKFYAIILITGALLLGLLAIAHAAARLCARDAWFGVTLIALALAALKFLPTIL